MIGRRCCRREMNENEACGGGAVEETRRPAAVESFPAKISSTQRIEDSSGSVDLFSRALKSLSDRSPFDIEDGATPTSSTLPDSIASFLLKNSDGKKRRKNSHSGVSSKFCRAENLRDLNFWDETEVYFRGLTSKDIELLQDGFCSYSMLATSLLHDNHFSAYSIAEASVDVNECELSERDGTGGNIVKSEDKDDEIIAKTHCKRENSLLQSCSNLEWLLGSRNKIFVTSERSSRKRDHSREDGEMEKLQEILLAEDGSGLGRCHVCSLGEVGDELNRLVVCRLCHVFVHQRCYGVCDDVDASWICSWCKYYEGIVKSGRGSSQKPCVLCPEQGGALKPVYKSSGCVEFAHLFCSLWTPDVYVDDTIKMEPVMNVGRVSDNSKKTACYLCKVENDPCMQCSHGRCRIFFHPICGREARQKFEIWGKFGRDVVELRAFCLKHSFINGSKIPEEFMETSSTPDRSLKVEETRGTVEDERDENRTEMPCNAGKADTCLSDSKSAVGVLKKFPVMCNKSDYSTGINGIDPSTVNGPPVYELKLEQLVKAKDRGLLDLSVEDELEGEVIYLQHQRLRNSLSLKHIIEDLISKVVQNLPKEIDSARERMWDDIHIKRCLYKLREAKKQGRKERRQREAQAILAAATAAASTSARVSSRRDPLDGSSRQQDKRVGSLIGVTSVKIPSEKPSSHVPQLLLEGFKGRSRICDVCQRPESAACPLLECHGCKVRVHLDCYRNVGDYTGPWYCELCGESRSRTSSVPATTSGDGPCFGVECGLCGGSSGAFRKSRDGRWVHSVCAELVLQSRFRRGQIEQVEGLEAVPRAEGVCIICRKDFGVCVKCSYGHCQTMFHPYCAKSKGFYSCIKKSQHKAYCERHSAEQRSKEEKHKYGVEELKNMKQIRVELERLRLLCERIIKREKIKREVAVCSQEILSCRRDSAAISALVRSRFVRDMSSESATTSLLGSEAAVQRSDDATTVDSTVSGGHHHHHLRPPPPSLPAEPILSRPPPSPFIPHWPTPGGRPIMAGKKVPRRLQSTPTVDDDEDGQKAMELRREREMFQKEIMMTSDQASAKNRKVPKGYIYVPVQGPGCSGSHD